MSLGGGGGGDANPFFAGVVDSFLLPAALSRGLGDRRCHGWIEEPGALADE